MGRGLYLLSAVGYFGLGAASLARCFDAAAGMGDPGQMLGGTPKLIGSTTVDASTLTRVLAKQAGVRANDPRLQQKIRYYDFNKLDSKVALLRTLIREGARTPQVVAAKNQILAKRCRDPNSKTGDGGWCHAEKNWDKELVAIFNWVRANVRYTRDPAHVDFFTSPEQTLLMKAGDCDDMVVVVGSLCIAAGMRVKLRVIRTQGSPDYNHIYNVVNPEGDGKKWIAIDASVARPAGWEAPGASDFMRNGKPAGMVLKVKDFDVV